MKKRIRDLSKIDTIILAGGLGNRLKPILKDRPKCMALINGVPFIDILINNCLKQGLRRFIICVGYLKEQVIDHLGNRNDCEIMFSQENKLLDTGGALKKAQPLIKSDIYLVFNGDSLININIDHYVNWFYKNELNISLVITRVNNSNRYGNVIINNNGFITNFEEKNNHDNAGNISTGVYLIKKSDTYFSDFDNIFSLEKDVFPYLVKQGTLSAFFCIGKFIDIGTEKSFRNAQLYQLKKNFS